MASLFMCPKSRPDLPKTSPEVTAAFAPRVWRLAAGRTLTLGPRGVLMGIINATPDSFSDGGENIAPSAAVATGAQMVADGAHILDIGAESTRPGAAEIDGDVERARLLPVLNALRDAQPETVLSVDTYRADTARAALIAGAHIINDVWGLQRDTDLAHVAAEAGAGVVIMHTGRGRHVLDDIIEDQLAFFKRSLEIATKAGLANDQIVLDPGFGFAKDVAANLELMARFEALHGLGFPLLAGTSRKRFIGHVTGREAQGRDAGTAATTALLRQKGAAVFRVHNVAINADTLAVTDAMLDPAAFA